MREAHYELIVRGIQTGDMDAYDLQGLVESPDDWLKDSLTETAAKIRDMMTREA